MWLFAIVVSPSLVSGQNQKEKGDIAFELFRYQEAKEYYEIWLEKNKNDYETRKALSEAYFLTKQYDVAEANLEPYTH